MRLPKRNTIIKYAITAGISALFAWIYLANHEVEYGPLAQQSRLDQYRLICDAFTIPGVLLVLSGFLVSIANEGALDGLSYLGHYMYHMFVPGKRSETMRYGDYVEAKKSKRISGFGFLIKSGAVCMAFALVFYALYKLNA